MINLSYKDAPQQNGAGHLKTVTDDSGILCSNSHYFLKLYGTLDISSTLFCSCL
jgi:hypothetical protein